MPKRRIIIRESDFEAISKRERSKYESITFTPLKKEYFERRATYFALKKKQYLADQYALYDYPNAMLSRLTNVKLYNSSYKVWLVKFNTDGDLVIRAGMRQPESKLGLMTIVEAK